ncbi:hypothetical protein [Deinococcus budaensis]|uniref:Uncharacterized protein n=1 Tax=Deinococcus budaensis TaxID=1665626 RepID=A0A7W8GF08_9DEIO|nr:hypothetical protein [Deinococcus budaensis]MBB5234417.1 hypothetical protein [Deinococcus budaensis]
MLPALRERRDIGAGAAPGDERPRRRHLRAARRPGLPHFPGLPDA